MTTPLGELATLVRSKNAGPSGSPSISSSPTARATSVPAGRESPTPQPSARFTAPTTTKSKSSNYPIYRPSRSLSPGPSPKARYKIGTCTPDNNTYPCSTCSSNSRRAIAQRRIGSADGDTVARCSCQPHRRSNDLSLLGCPIAHSVSCTVPNALFAALRAA